jgi:hypothetical protein
MSTSGGGQGNRTLTGVESGPVFKTGAATQYLPVLHEVVESVYHILH